MSIAGNLQKIKQELPGQVSLVAVSKTKPVEAIQEAYEAGQRIFGENKIQEMTEKWEALPKDIQWHMIGHVQRNKVKYMAPYVSLIHGVDSFKLLKEIDKQAHKNERVIDCLLQLKIAEEDSKFGMGIDALKKMLLSAEFQQLTHIRIKGFMGMATLTSDDSQIAKEFKELKTYFDTFSGELSTMEILSMGMSADYKIAIDQGSTMVRIGSAIFGERNYAK